MENPLSLNQNIFAYIDTLPDLDSAKQLNTFLDIKSIKKVFWESFKKYFATKSALEKQKAKLKCNYINRYFCSGITLNKNINQFITPHGFYGIFISSAAKIGTGCTIFQIAIKYIGAKLFCHSAQILSSVAILIRFSP